VTGPKTVGGWVSKKRLRVDYKLTIATYDVGERKILPYEIQFINVKTGESKTLPINELTINVTPVKRKKTDGNDIRDIKPQENLPPGKTFYFILFLILVFCIDYLWYRYYYRKKEEETGAGEFVPDKLPDEIAYEQLAKLQELNLVQQGKIKEYYIELSEIMRRYLSARFKIHVIERTTEEVYGDLRKLNVDVPSGVIIPKDWKKIVVVIKGFLDNADMVKFAKHVPKPGEIDADYETVKHIIEVTKYDYGDND
jgi:hypothetical protein